MEPVLIVIAIAVGAARAIIGHRQRSARSTVARAFRGLPTATDARPLRLPRGRFGR